MNWNRHKLPALLMLMIVVYSCASMGNPMVVRMMKNHQSLSGVLLNHLPSIVKRKKVTIEF